MPPSSPEDASLEGQQAMPNLATVIQDLVIANRILAREEVVDAFCHVSVRNPENRKPFFLARSLSPELVEAGDIVELGLDGQPVREETRPLYLERFIHFFFNDAPPTDLYTLSLHDALPI